jgi:hypothetical protein
VLAPAAGDITFAGTVPSSGKSVTITTADGYAVTLTQLGSITVNKGATVAEGDGVGTIAATGDTDISQPYVHLGVRIAAEAQGYLDPLTLLPQRALAPAVLVPAAVVDPPPAAAPLAEPAPPAPAPVVNPEPRAEPAPVVDQHVPSAAPAAAPAPVVESAPAAPTQSVTETAAPGERAPEATPSTAPSLGSRPMSVDARPVTSIVGVAREPVPAPQPDGGGAPVRGAGRTAFNERAAATHRVAAVDDAPRHRALGTPRVSRVQAAGRSQRARSFAHAAAAIPARAAIVAGAHRGRGSAPLLAVITVLVAAALAGVLGAVRMMVRHGIDAEEEDPGRSGLAVCSGAPSPWTRGGLRRPLGRVRALSPSEGQRRPHGEWHRRARHTGDGGRRQGGQVLR